MSTLRVELFHDDEAGNWHYRVPALHINGGGTATRGWASSIRRKSVEPERGALTMNTGLSFMNVSFSAAATICARVFRRP